jgi:hypothetical protein
MFKQFSITLISVLSLGLVQAQTLQNFNGAYPLSGDFTWVIGQANYNFKEMADYTKSREGKFSFTSNMTGNQFGQYNSARFDASVDGSYKNNLKEGAWTHNIKFTKVSDINSHTVIKANYKEGYPQGKWTIALTDLSSNLVAESIELNFVKGLIVGNFSKENSYTEFKVSGSTDNLGYIHGKLTLIEQGSEMIQEYVHGVVVRTVYRNPTTGEVYRNEAVKQEDLDMIANLQKMAKENPAALEDVPYKLVESQAPFNQLFLKSFELMQYKDFPGDALYNTQSDDYKWDGLKIIQLVPQETKAQKEAKALAQAEEKRKYEEAQEAYRKEEALTAQANALLNQVTKNEEDLKYSFTGAGYTKKPNLYNAYDNLLRHYYERYNASEDLNESIALLQKILSLQDKVAKLAPGNTKDLEKSLKGLQDPKAIEAIFDAIP